MVLVDHDVVAEVVGDHPFVVVAVEQIAGARFKPIEKAGHFPHIEQPAEFARRVLAFADAAAPPAPRAKRA